MSEEISGAGEWRWPLTSWELDVAGGNGLKPEHIASYAYPEGARKRYTLEGAHQFLKIGGGKPLDAAWFDLIDWGFSVSTQMPEAFLASVERLLQRLQWVKDGTDTLTSKDVLLHDCGTTIDTLTRELQSARTTIAEQADWCSEAERLIIEHTRALVQCGDTIAEQGREIAAVRERGAQLECALNPRVWSVAMSDAWHRAIPDTMKAFADLKDAALSHGSAAKGEGK